MTRFSTLLATAASITASPLAAEVPVVATDIAPVHGLVASVMGDLGTPALLVPQGASPHHYALKPSQARALQDADAVFWIGPDLSPDIGRKIDAVSNADAVVSLATVPGTSHLPSRDTPVFDAAMDGHDEHDHDEHTEEQDEHEADAHAEGHDEDADHADAHDDQDEHAHDHDGDDPHLWLSPENAAVWLGSIADTLATLDADNAETYRTNAEAAQARLTGAVDVARDALSTAHDSRFVVFHDAYQYFETAFGLHVAGAIQLSDATAPSPARLDSLRDEIREADIACIFAEPQFDPRLIDAVTEGSDVRVAELDPLGFGIEPGPEFYPTMIESIATKIADCLK